MKLSSKRWLALAVFVTVGLVADQLALRLLMDDGRLLGRRVAPFDPPIFHEEQERGLARLSRFLQTGEPEASSFFFDAELGWCPPRAASLGEKTFDEGGARVGSASLTADRTPGVKRVVALGCSFTLGDEVADSEAWPYQLDQLHDSVELVNLGMSAYGLDQAWLRYRRDGRPYAPDEVWLGWMPAASLRLGTLFRPVVHHWTGPLLFKPRFRVRGNELELVPNPAASLRDVHRLLVTQADFFEVMHEDDLWVHRSPGSYAPLGSSWLHESGLGRLWLTYAERGARDPAVWLEDESAELRELVVRIVMGLRDEVESEGARFRLLVLPDQGALEFLEAHGRGYWQGVMTELSAAGVQVLDLSTACQRQGMLHDQQAWAPGAHYSVKGNRLIADAIMEGLGSGGRSTDQ